jgi:hypothetical protein
MEATEHPLSPDDQRRLQHEIRRRPLIQVEPDHRPVQPERLLPVSQSAGTCASTTRPNTSAIAPLRVPACPACVHPEDASVR